MYCKKRIYWHELALIVVKSKEKPELFESINYFYEKEKEKKCMANSLPFLAALRKKCGLCFIKKVPVGANFFL